MAYIAKGHIKLFQGQRRNILRLKRFLFSEEKKTQSAIENYVTISEITLKEQTNEQSKSILHPDCDR